MSQATAGTHPIRPSPAQWQALEERTPERPMLLQIHWAWASSTAPTAAFESALVELKSLGGTALTHARCDTQFIGDQTTDWHSASVWSLPTRRALLALVHSDAFVALSNQARDIRALVALLPPHAVQRALKIASALMRFLPAPAASGPIPMDAISGGVNPTPEQFAAFKQCPQNTPIHMFNLLKFKREVKDGETGMPTTGKRLYGQRYAPVACQCIFRLGGRIVAMGKYALTLIGNGGDPAPHAWDEIVVAHYPGRSAFVRMLSNDAYQKAVVHREAGLESTELWSASPMSGLR